MDLVFGALGTWAALLLVILSLGSFFAVSVSHTFNPAMVRVALWVGFVALAVVTTATNLFMPLKSSGAILILIFVMFGSIIGAILVIRLRTRRGQALRVNGWEGLSPAIWVLVAGIFVVSLWWLVALTRAPTNYDSGLYHIHAIWYAADYATIPGLSNLYPSYGFSNSLNPVTAITTNGPLGMEAYRAIVGFFFVVFFIELILRLVSRPEGRVGTKVLLITVCVFVAPMVGMVDYWVTSPTFDTPVALLTFVGIAALADLLTRKHPGAADVFLALAPLALASSMRQHYWFLFAFSFLIVGWKVWKVAHLRMRRTFYFTTMFVTVLFIVMLARDYLLSGWVMYPYKTFAFNVDWLAPDPEGLINSTKQWARSPTPAYQQASEGWGWVRPWIGANYTSWVILALLAMLVISLIVWIVSRNLWRPRILVVLLVPQLLFLATWFLLGAPHIRYVWAPLLLLGALPLAWSWSALENRLRRPEILRDVAIAATGAGLALAVLVAFAVVLPRLTTETPQPTVSEVPLSDSITLLVPGGTDQCWSNYPVCSGMASPGIEPRGDSVADGFRIKPVN